MELSPCILLEKDDVAIRKEIIFKFGFLTFCISICVYFTFLLVTVLWFHYKQFAKLLMTFEIR